MMFLERLLYALRTARIAFAEAWLQWEIEHLLARRMWRRMVGEDLHERNHRLRLIRGGKGRSQKRLPGNGAA